MPDAAILLVEDREDDIVLTTRAFRRAGIDNEIVVARDGVEALALLLPQDGSTQLLPAIVLLDLNMPRLGGLDVLQRLRAEPTTRLLPVIILTTSTEESDIIDGYGFGANGYVRKPVTSEEFVKAAAALGVYWLSYNIARPTAGADPDRLGNRGLGVK
jgi:two-component system response regulator